MVLVSTGRSQQFSVMIRIDRVASTCCLSAVLFLFGFLVLFLLEQHQSRSGCCCVPGFDVLCVGVGVDLASSFRFLLLFTGASCSICGAAGGVVGICVGGKNGVERDVEWDGGGEVRDGRKGGGCDGLRYRTGALHLFHKWLKLSKKFVACVSQDASNLCCFCPSCSSLLSRSSFSSRSLVFCFFCFFLATLVLGFLRFFD